MEKCLILFHFQCFCSLKVNKSLDFESHWDTLVFFDKKDMTLDLNMFHEKMSTLLLFPLFGFNLVITIREFNYKSH